MAIVPDVNYRRLRNTENGRFAKAGPRMCPHCRTRHDPRHDPIKELKGQSLIYAHPETFFFFGKHVVAIPATRSERYPKPPTKEPYLGLEVENDIPAPYDYYKTQEIQGELADIWYAYNLGLVKTDCTVSGTESVTWPFTFKRLITSGIDKALVEMKKAGARAWKRGGPGLHIHISRKAFKDDQHMWRFCALHEANGPVLRQLAGRGGIMAYNKWADEVLKSPTYKRYANEMYCPSTDFLLKKQTPESRYMRARGMAVNLIPYQTIELRFWKGTLQPVGVLGAAACESAMYEFAKRVPTIPKSGWDVLQDPALNWETLMEWAQSEAPVEHEYITELTELRSSTSSE